MESQGILLSRVLEQYYFESGCLQSRAGSVVANKDDTTLTRQICAFSKIEPLQQASFKVQEKIEKVTSSAHTLYFTSHDCKGNSSVQKSELPVYPGVLTQVAALQRLASARDYGNVNAEPSFSNSN